MNEAIFNLLVFVGSFFGGVLGALTGLGSGVVVIPLLVLGFGVEIHYAMGAALTSVIATSSGAAASFLRDGFSNMNLGLFLCVATTIGAVGGAFLAAVLHPAVLSLIFGVVLLCSGLLSLCEGRESTRENPDPLAVRLRLDSSYPHEGTMRSYHVHHTIPGFFLMSIAGILSGLLGIGSGAFNYLTMGRVMKIPFRVATATSNFIIGVTAAASVGMYLKRGYLDPALVSPVALGVLAGAFTGVKLLSKAPLKLLKRILLIAIFVAGVEMILQGIR